MFTIRREAFWIGQYAIHWYGLIMAFSVLIAILLASRESKRLGLPQDTIVDFALIGVPLATIFARLYYVAFEWETFSGNLWRIIAIWEGGIAMYGSLIGGAIAAVILTRIRKLRFSTLVDAIAPGLVLAQAIGRWGNFTNQEAYGPISSEAAQWFPISVFIERTGQWHLATFFYESMWCLLVFLVLWFIIKNHTYENGQTFSFYLLLYGAGRSVIEGLRTDSLYLGALRISQFGSVLVMFCVCLFFYYHRNKRGLVRNSDKIALGGALLAGVIGVCSHNAIITDIYWINWLGTFICALSFIAIGFYIWHIPAILRGDPAHAAAKAQTAKSYSPTRFIEETEENSNRVASEQGKDK